MAFALSGLGHAHARTGDLAGSAAELRQAIAIWNRSLSSSSESRYVEAGCHAILAGLSGKPGSEVTPPAAEQEARKAIEMLKESIESGYRTAAEVRADPSFQPLAGRSDFENLLRDLALPDNPFAADD
jgi:hypothetical protein